MRPRRATCVENPQRAEGEKFDICPQIAVAVMRARTARRVPNKRDARDVFMMRVAAHAYRTSAILR